MSKSDLVNHFEDRYQQLKNDPPNNSFAKMLYQRLAEGELERIPKSIKMYEKMARTGRWFRLLGIGLAGCAAIMGAFLFSMTLEPKILIILAAAGSVPIITIFMPARRYINDYRKHVEELQEIEGKFASLLAEQNEMMN